MANLENLDLADNLVSLDIDLPVVSGGNLASTQLSVSPPLVDTQTNQFIEKILQDQAEIENSGEIPSLSQLLQTPIRSQQTASTSVPDPPLFSQDIQPAISEHENVQKSQK